MRRFHRNKVRILFLYISIFIIAGLQNIVAQSTCDQTIQAGESIQNGIDQAEAGDVVCVAPGTYQEALSISTESISLVAEDNEDRPILDGDGQPGGVPGISISEAADISLESLVIQGYRGAGISVFDSPGVSVLQSDILDNDDDGIHLASESFSAWIEDNTITGNGSANPSTDYAGIRISSSDSATVSGNTLQNNWKNGLEMQNSEEATLENNSISDNDEYGFYVTGPGASDIQNNVFSGHSRHDLYINEKYNSVIDSNEMEVGMILRVTESTDPEDYSYTVVNNSVQGQDVFYAENESDPTIPSDAGQVILNKITGATVSGLSFDGIAVPVHAAFGSDITVTNIMAENSPDVLVDQGVINIWNSGSPTITNNTLSGNNGWGGIVVVNASDAQVEDNTLSGNNYAGIRFFDVSNSDILGNSVAESGRGIMLEEAVSVTVDDNDIDRNSVAGVLLGRSSIVSAHSENVTISSNRFNDNEDRGIVSNRSVGTVVENNDIQNNANSAIVMTGDSQTQESSDNAVIQNNTITGSEWTGIVVTRSDGVQVNNNTSQQNGRAGISGQSVTNFTVSGNTVDDNEEEGITLAFVETVTASNNEGTGNLNGFTARDITDGEITQNTFSGNTESGILFGGTTGNESVNGLIRNNTLSNNGEYGLVLQSLAIATTADENTVTGNTLGGILDSGTGSVIQNNQTDENNGGGVVLLESTDASVSENTADGNDVGILADDAANAVISDNSIINSAEHGIRVMTEATGSTLDANSFTGNAVDALLDHVETITVSNNSMQAGLIMLGNELVQFDHTLSGNTVQGSDLFYSYDETSPSIPASPGQVIIAGSNDATISGLSFDGVAAPIQLAFDEQTSLSDNTITNAAGHGIMLNQSGGTTLSGNSIQYNSEELLDVGNGISIANVTDLQLSEPTINNAPENGIRVDGGDNISVENADISGSSEAGVLVSNLTGGSITGSVITQSGDNGINVYESDTVSVENIEVTGSGKNGIYLLESIAVSVDESEFTGNAQNGFFAEDSEELELANSTFSDNDESGAFFGGTLLSLKFKNVTVSGNDFTNNGESGLDLLQFVNATVLDNQFNGNGANGLKLTRTDSVLVRQNSSIENSADGFFLDQNAQADSLWFMENFAEDNSEAGIRLETTSSGNEGTLLNRNEVLGNNTGLLMDVVGGFSNQQIFEGVRIENNRFENQVESAIQILKEPADPAGLVLTGNTIQNNGFGVLYDVDSGFAGPDEYPDARQNWWGSSDGPSGDVEDPETGAVASGSGDEVSEYVRFDPFLESVQVEGVYFAVNNLSSNSPVDVGEELQVEAAIENRGDEQGTQTITLTDENDNTLSSEDITLDSAEEQNITLAWMPEAEDSGELELMVASSDEQETISVQILEEGEFTEVAECTTLDQPGNYRLTADLESSSSCIEIIAPDIRFDGDGYSINLEETASGQHFGIEIPTGEVRENIIVENVTLEGWFTGLFAGETTQSTYQQITVHNSSNGLTLYDANNNTVSDVTVTGNTRGVYIGGTFGETGSSDNVVKNVSASDNSIAGLFVASGEGNQFQQMELSGNQQGVQVTSDDANSYEDIEARNNSRNGINLVAGSGNEFTRVEAVANEWYGFNIEEVSGNRFTNIEARENSWTGIHLAGSFSDPVTGNEFDDVLARDNAENGMFLSYSSENRFEELLIESNGWNAVEISSQSEENSFIDGEMIGNERNGISVASESHSNGFEKLTLTGNGTGENHGAVLITTESKYNNLLNLQVSGGTNGLIIATDSTSADSISVTQTTGTGIALTEGATGNELTNSEISGSDTDLEFSGGAEYNTLERLDFNGAVVSLDGFDIAVNAVTTPPEEPENGQPLGLYLDIGELTEQGNLDYLNIFYEASDTGNLDEESLSIWRYTDSGEWKNPESAGYSSGVNTDEKFVFAESVSDFSVFGVISGDMDTSLNPDEQPVVFELNQNYPNPFNPSTRIEYALPEPANVQLEVFNMIGERMAILVNEDQTPGWHEVRFDAGSLASGVYFYKIRAGNYTEIRKMTLIK